MSSYLTLALVMVAVGMVVTACLVYLAGRSIIRPPRMTDGKAIYVLNRLTPRDVGLEFEPRSFVVSDLARAGEKLKIAGWWIPAKRTGSAKTVILVHGYADAKVGALAWAPLWAELGFNILAIDLRAHGESEGFLCSGGYFERDDLAQVVSQLIAAEPNSCQTLVLFGASLGAGVVAGAAELLTVADAALTKDDSTDRRVPRLAVVLDSPYADFRTACTAHLVRFGLMKGPLTRWTISWAERLCGARFSESRPIDLATRARCPVLVLAAEIDPYLTDDEAEEWRRFGTLSAENRTVLLTGVEHLMGVVTSAENYRAAVKAFVQSIEALV